MKVLIVKLSSLGDVVHAMPAVQDIRRALPQTRIDWVVERGFAPLVARCEGVGRVIPCEIRRWRKAPLSAQTRVEWAAFRADLQSQAYDAVIDLQGLSKSALVAWLAAEAGTRPLHEAVAGSVALLRGSLGFRGFNLVDETAGAAGAARVGGLREVLPASLLWLTDSAGPPAQVTLAAQRQGGQVTLVLALTPGDGAAGSGDEPAYRPLDLEELHALARAEGIALAAAGDRLTLTLRCDE